MTEPTLLEAAD